MPGAPAHAERVSTVGPRKQNAASRLREERPDDHELVWTLDRSHWPGPLSPLAFEVAGEPLAKGLMAALSAYELPVSEVRIRRINGHRYQAKVPLSIDGPVAKARRRRSQEKLRRAMGCLRQSWTDRWLPDVRTQLEHWEEFRLGEASLAALLDHVDETMARLEHVWRIHFLLAIPMRRAIKEFVGLHRELFGTGTLDALGLLKGFDNETIRASRALWSLSRLGRRNPNVLEILSGDAARAVGALEGSTEGRGFLVELQSFLERYGRRGSDLDLERPSWAEDPRPVIEQLAALAVQRDRDLGSEKAAIERQREALVAHASAALEGYPEPVRSEFEFLLRAAQEAMVLSEDHNLWIDASCMHQVRQVFLEVGRRLAAEGRLADRQDVFCLTTGELMETAHALRGRDRRGLVARRRAEMERFRAITPPAVLGGEPVQAARRDVAGTDAASGIQLACLDGQACSPGTARGTARLVPSLSQAGILRRGDVLVTEALSPSWTALFPTLAAIVSNAGGVLSHAAVVAREYGVPAVLGVERATTVIRDGQVLEVDGARGTVQVLSEPYAWRATDTGR
jgi:phosphohistidine swiveling domain-containing protein